MANQIEPQCVYNRSLEWMLDQLDNGVRASVFVETDLPSGVPMLMVYTDDGEGNGDCLLALPLVALRELARRYDAVVC